MNKRLYFFKAIFGLWLVLKSLFFSVAGGLMLAVLISFGYYYFSGQIFSHWFGATLLLMVAIFVIWMCADYKQTMAQAVKVAEMDDNVITANIVFRIVILVILVVICLVLYGAYHLATG